MYKSRIILPFGKRQKRKEKTPLVVWFGPARTFSRPPSTAIQTKTSTRLWPRTVPFCDRHTARLHLQTRRDQARRPRLRSEISVALSLPKLRTFLRHGLRKVAEQNSVRESKWCQGQGAFNGTLIPSSDVCWMITTHRMMEKTHNMNKARSNRWDTRLPGNTEKDTL